MKIAPRAGVVAVALIAAGSTAAIVLPASEARRRPASTMPATTTSTTPAAPATGRLRFGVYPWGATGCVEQCAPSVPDDAGAAMAAVQRLRGGRPFVVHLYGDYTGVSNASADGLLSEAAWWASSGVHVAAVLRYRPADSARAAGYVAWVRAQTRRLAALSATVSIQIANEPTNMSPGAGDGSYPGVVAAIATAVPAARAEVVAAGRRDILVGFNWAAGEDPATTEPLWADLRRAGGRAFARSVGFVAVNVYPGTWSAPLGTSAPTAVRIDAAMRTILGAMRNRHMVAAGVGAASIVVGETGYPTTRARTPARQDAVLRAIVATVDATKAHYGVSDLYWFSLRDGNTASGQLENGYGLLRDDGTAKPAFATMQRLVASVGA